MGRTCQKRGCGDCEGSAYRSIATGNTSVNRLTSDAKASTCSEGKCCHGLVVGTSGSPTHPHIISMVVLFS